MIFWLSWVTPWGFPGEGTVLQFLTWAFHWPCPHLFLIWNQEGRKFSLICQRFSEYIALSCIALFFIIVPFTFWSWHSFFFHLLLLNAFMDTFETLYEGFMRLPDSGWRLFCQDSQAPKFFLPPRVLNQCLNRGPLWISGAISGPPPHYRGPKQCACIPHLWESSGFRCPGIWKLPVIKGWWTYFLSSSEIPKKSGWKLWTWQSWRVSFGNFNLERGHTRPLQWPTFCLWSVLLSESK